MSLNKSNIAFALIHSYVWGPSLRTTISGRHWFVIFVNDCTRMTWLYLMIHVLSCACFLAMDYIRKATNALTLPPTKFISLWM